MVRVADEPWDRPTDCRAHIATAVCVVNAGSSTLKRPCLDGAAPYIAQFEALYDSFTPELQKMFCSLRHLYIENQITSTAYAQSLVKSDGTPAGGANVGIRRSILDQALHYAPWESWKEQLSFGGTTQSYVPSATLPFYELTGPDNIQVFLYAVMAHEFGHLFDFANGLNRFGSTGPTGWSVLSWSNASTPIPNDDFADRKKFCFYSCGGNTSDISIANALYSALDQTSFISSYAATNPWDDFAESISYYYLHQHLGRDVTLNTSQGMQFPVTGKLSAPVFTQKLNYIQNFLSRSDILYP
jgi:hypothetical protein